MAIDEEQGLHRGSDFGTLSGQSFLGYSLPLGEGHGQEIGLFLSSSWHSFQEDEFFSDSYSRLIHIKTHEGVELSQPIST